MCQQNGIAPPRFGRKRTGADKLDLRSDTLSAELRRHAQSVAQLAETLEQAEDFPNKTARDFCGVIRASAKLVYDRLSTAPPDRLPHIHVLLSALGEDLRYAERSRVEHTPWSLVQAMETFLQGKVGNQFRFIIRPQWSYNYAIVGDLLATYEGFFSSFPDWISLAEWHAAIGGSASDRIFSISFPRVERMNVLTHAAWGHEVGHILISEWMTKHFDGFWQKGAMEIEKAIRAEIEKDIKGPTLVVEQIVASYLNDTLSLTRQSLKELISDAVGAHFLGPAAFASLSEFSCRFDLDENPVDGGYYPPWRFRLRKLAQIILPEVIAATTDKWNPALLDYITWLKEWQKVTDSDADLISIQSDVRSRKAYELLEANYSTICAQVIGQLRPELQIPFTLTARFQEIGELIERIELGVPPNETGLWPETAPAEMPDIWNAAWACKVSRFTKNNGPEFDEYLTMLFQLALKAIEASYVHSTFGPLLPT